MSIPPHRNIQESDRNLSVREDSTIDKAGDPDALDKSFESGKILGNILSLGSGEIVSRTIAFLGITYVARRLGPEEFGIIGFAAALFGYLSLAVTAGFNDIGAREVARRPREASSIAASVMIVRLALACVALLAIGLVAWSLNKPPTVKLVLLLMGLLFFPLALDTSWVYKGLERNRLVGIALILSQILYVGTVLMVVDGPRDITLVPLAQFFGEMSAALMLAVLLFRSGKIRLNLREGLSIFRSSSFWAVSRLMRTLMYTFSVVLLGFVLGEREVGLYTAPYRICFLLVAIAVVIHSSYLPAITRAVAQSVEQAGATAERSVNLAVTIAAPLIVGGMVTSASLLQVVFGPEYTEGAAAFRFLILSVGFVFIHGAVHNLLVAYDRLKAEMLIFAVAAALNVGLNILIITRYGLVGAGFVAALAEAVTLLLGLVVLGKIGVRYDLRFIWRPVAASCLMGASLIALGTHRALGVYLAAGCVVYFFALIVLRGIPQDARPFLQTAASYAGDFRRGRS
ncbi:MAG: flippase [Acidobacteriota bacterium]|nr:flippase [Acidobacteriota bacterium]